MLQLQPTSPKQNYDSHSGLWWSIVISPIDKLSVMVQNYFGLKENLCTFDNNDTVENCETVLWWIWVVVIGDLFNILLTFWLRMKYSNYSQIEEITRLWEDSNSQTMDIFLHNLPVTGVLFLLNYIGISGEESVMYQVRYQLGITEIAFR